MIPQCGLSPAQNSDVVVETGLCRCLSFMMKCDEEPLKNGNEISSKQKKTEITYVKRKEMTINTET